MIVGTVKGNWLSGEVMLISLGEQGRKSVSLLQLFARGHLFGRDDLRSLPAADICKQLVSRMKGLRRWRWRFDEVFV